MQTAGHFAIREEALLISSSFGAAEAKPSARADKPGLVMFKEILDGMDKPIASTSPILQAEGSPGWLFVLIFFLTDVTKERPTAGWDKIISAGKLEADTGNLVKKHPVAKVFRIFSKEDLDKVRCKLVLEGGAALRLRVQAHTHTLKLLPLLQELDKALSPPRRGR
jgi:hypothetical protein